MITKHQESRMYLDVIKGITIFLMLWGHCIQFCMSGSGLDFFENSVFKVIYSFHMPLFMLVSGYLFFFSFEKRNLNDLIAHRSKPLVYSIVFCGTFNFYITTGLYNVIKGNFGSLFGGAWIQELGSLWFLWSVLVASLGVALVCKSTNKPVLQILLLSLFTVVILLFPNINMNLYMYPYFIIGFYYAKYRHKISAAIKNVKYISLVVYPIMCLFYEKKHFIYTSGIIGSAYTIKEYIFIDIFRWLIGIFGSVFVLVCVELIFKAVTKKSAILSALSKIGQNSLQFYCLSTAILSSWLSVGFPYILKLFNIGNLFVANQFIYNFVFTPLLTVSYTVILHWLTKFLYKIRLGNLLFGR